MTPRSLRLMMFVILLVLCAQTPVMAQGTPSQDKRSRLDSIKQLLGLKRSEYQTLEGQERNLTAELDRIEQALKTYQEQLDAQKSALAQHQRELAAIEKRLADLETSRAQKKSALATRLRAIYKMGDLGYLTPLLAASSSENIDQHIKYLQVISQNDLTLMTETKSAMQTIRDEQKTRQAQQEQVVAVKQEIAQQLTRMQAQQQEKEALLRKIEADKQQSLALIRELEGSAGELQTFLDDLEKQPVETPRPPRQETPAQQIVIPEDSQQIAQTYTEYFRGNKGKLLWPVEGKILTNFGPVRIGDTYTTSNGVDIQAQRGTPFYAVFKGKVMFSGWFKNYGKIVIIDHGGNFLTLYAHAEEIAVQAGQTVKTRQMLGKVGDSGSLKGTSLHFEVRANGKPEDPKRWLKN